MSYLINIGLALVAIVCGILGRSRKQKYANAGLILGIITILMTIIILIAGIVLYSNIFVEETSSSIGLVNLST